MALSEEKRAIIEEAIAAGKSPKEIAEQAGVSVTTVYNFKKQEVDDPKGTAPPIVTTEGKGKSKRITRKPITEETAGQLCAGIFAIAAMLDGPEWFLTPEEREALASPFAESLRILPAPIAEGVNLYSAPVVFITTLSTIMYKKGTQRARRGNRPPLRSVPPHSNSSTVSSPVQNANTQSPAPANARTSVSENTNANAQPQVDVAPAVVAAAAAAKASLTQLDEGDQSENHFS